jgi:hypothetical protein
MIESSADGAARAPQLLMPSARDGRAGQWCITPCITPCGAVVGRGGGGTTAATTARAASSLARAAARVWRQWRERLAWAVLGEGKEGEDRAHCTCCLTMVTSLACMSLYEMAALHCSPEPARCCTQRRVPHMRTRRCELCVCVYVCLCVSQCGLSVWARVSHVLPVPLRSCWSCRCRVWRQHACSAVGARVSSL